MKEIILDVSANTTKGDIKYFVDMVEEVKRIDTKKHLIIFKTQLFKSNGPESKNNRYLQNDEFNQMFEESLKRGYMLTASVFDYESLDFLLKYRIPFVKIACRPDLYWLGKLVPTNIPLYISLTANSMKHYSLFPRITPFVCVPKYPASIDDYTTNLAPVMAVSISDHTDEIVFFKSQPHVSKWEMHYVLEHDKDNPDSCVAKTPKDLEQIL